MKKSFTLIELIVSCVIIGLLLIILFKLFSTILNISVRIENEKTINNEMLHLAQIFQNISDKNNRIDYTKYENSDGVSRLINDKGITNILYLTGIDGEISLYATGNCIDSAMQYRNPDNNCWIEMTKDGKIIELTNKSKSFVINTFFKILPYEDIDKYSLKYDDIYHEGFWFNTKIFIKKYNPKSRSFDVNLIVQNFYNIRSY